MGSPLPAGRHLYMKYAILIDAGFLKRKLGSQDEPLDVNGVRTFLDALRAHDALVGMNLHRVYWYDAPPLDTRVTKPLLGGKGQFRGHLPGSHKCALARCVMRSTLRVNSSW